MAATAAAPASATPALATQTTTRSAPAAAPAPATPARMSFSMASKSDHTNPDGTPVDCGAWDNAMAHLLVALGRQFRGPLLVEAGYPLARNNCTQFLVEPALAETIRQFIMDRLPSLNATQLTMTQTPANNRLITIPYTGTAPVFRPFITAPPPVAPAVTKTST